MRILGVGTLFQIFVVIFYVVERQNGVI